MGWSSFLMRVVPAMSWAQRCQRLLKLGHPCNLSIGPVGCPDVFCTLFYHARLLHGICVVLLLGSHFLTAIYRSGVFRHFNL